MTNSIKILVVLATCLTLLWAATGVVYPQGPEAEVEPPPATIQADFDRDGLLDLVEVAAAAAGDLRLGDVDGDGYLDLIDGGTRLALPALDSPLVAPADTVQALAAWFAPVWRTSAYLESPKYHLVANLDGDPANDLVVADYNGAYPNDVATLHIYENSGDNAFAERWSFAGGPRIWTDMAVGDPDRDGHLELVVGKLGGRYAFGSWAPPRVYIFGSTGDDAYQLERIIDVAADNVGLTGLEALELADVDQDGRPEVIFVERVVTTLKILEVAGAF